MMERIKWNFYRVILFSQLDNYIKVFIKLFERYRYFSGNPSHKQSTRQHLWHSHRFCYKSGNLGYSKSVSFTKRFPFLIACWILLNASLTAATFRTSAILTGSDANSGCSIRLVKRVVPLLKIWHPEQSVLPKLLWITNIAIFLCLSR